MKHASGDIGSEAKVFELLEKLFSGVEGLSKTIKTGKMKIQEFRNANPTPYGDSPGVYIFINNGEIVYIGRSLNSLGHRLWEQIKAGENPQSAPEWASVVNSNNTNLLIIALPKDQNYWASSLETFLIDNTQPRPRFNSRIT